MWVQNGSLPGDARAERDVAGLARHVVAGVVAAVVAVAALGGCRGAHAPAPPGVLSISVEKQSAWVRNFNPLAPGEGARFPTRAGVYEPLLIFNTRHGRLRAVARDELRVVRRITSRCASRCARRAGPTAPRFSAADVVYDVRPAARSPRARPAQRLGLPRRTCAPSIRAHRRAALPARLRAGPRRRRAAVHRPGARVARRRRSRDVREPEPRRHGAVHGGARLPQPGLRARQEPVLLAAGPAAVEALRFLAYPANEQANLALVEGDVDWAGDFVPSVERTFVRRDPAHNHYWFPLVGSMVFLYANTARAPFDDVRVRKALSMGIDRPKIVDVAMYGYTRPADATGLTDAYAAWRDPALAARDWVTLDVAAREPPARRGRLRARRRRRAAHARRAAVPVRRRGRQRVVGLGARGPRHRARSRGARASTSSCAPTSSAPGTRASGAASSICRSPGRSRGRTPYGFYRWLMSSRTVRPLGEMAGGNWHRFGDPAADELLARFEVTDDVALAARARRADRGALRRARAGDPAVPEPGLGRLQHAPLRGLPVGRAPLRVAVAPPRARAAARADDARAQGRAARRRPPRGTAP